MQAGRLIAQVFSNNSDRLKYFERLAAGRAIGSGLRGLARFDWEAIEADKGVLASAEGEQDCHHLCGHVF